ncbi:MAG TPA: hypothetical protein VD838_14205, partial [Anaeromyxobacteraceae bacterium]|nr:hypothetical protein [Anaeromyxobacteraceae bacterium]
MPEPGSLPAADRSDAGSDARPETPAGTLPAARPEAEERPSDAALPPAEAEAPQPLPPPPPVAPAEAPEAAPPPEAPPLPEGRKERIREATARGGLAVLPPGFADPDGDWRIVESESPFERLYLDAAQHARVTPALVQRHYDLLGAFWKEVVAALDGPGQARIREKYGGEAKAAEVVRQRARRTEEAYRQLVAEGGIEAAFAEA